MTPREADRIIRNAKPVTVQSRYGERFEILPIRRDRWSLYVTVNGRESVFSRDDLHIVTDKGE